MKLLGQGGQGFVFWINSPRYGDKALKWYFPEQATMQQYDAIMDAIRRGSPDEEGEQAYIWPYDVVEGSTGFGYVMPLIDKKRYLEYGDMIRDTSLAPSLKMRCIISYKLVNAYHKLHLRGYCYRDLSDGNFMFDPKTGSVIISDNDNVGVEGLSSSQVLGTLEFMAPEVINGESKPGVNTDLYSLAILLFKFWVWHHPYHGNLEYMMKSLDMTAKKWLYGTNPVFIFDPLNDTNRLPRTPAHDSIQKMWDLLPTVLKDAFLQVFTWGIKDKEARLKEYQWEDVFQRMIDSLVYCPHDKAENFYEAGKPLVCWHCGRELKAPPVLLLKTKAGERSLVLSSGMKLYGSHLDEFGRKYNPGEVISYMTQNPLDKSIWGLYNGTKEDWEYRFSNGRVIQVPRGMNAPVIPGSVIQFEPGMQGLITLGDVVSKKEVIV